MSAKAERRSVMLRIEIMNEVQTAKKKAEKNNGGMEISLRVFLENLIKKGLEVK